MYQYTFSDEDKKLIEEQSKKTKTALKDKFDDIDKKYPTSFQGNEKESLGLDKMTFTKPSDEEIKKQAENSLNDYKTATIESIDDKYLKKQDEINKLISDKKVGAEAMKNELEQKYSSLKQDTSNDAIKRGLARSSIVVNTLEAFDKSMLDNFMEINNKLTNSIDSLNNQKMLLTNQKQNALNAFDISYAVKLNDKIEKINEKLKEEEDKVIKYNNEIAEKEAEYKRNRQKEALEYAEFINEYGNEYMDSIKFKEKYKVALDYFMNIPKEQALKELEDDTSIKTQLGNYYNGLISKIKDR